VVVTLDSIITNLLLRVLAKEFSKSVEYLMKPQATKFGAFLFMNQK